MISAIAKALLGDTLDTVIDRVVPDVNLRKEAKIELEKALVDAANASMLAQIEVNKESAKHPSVFVAGARPGAMWICNAGIAYHFILYPIIMYCTAIWAPDVTPPPKMDVFELMTLLSGTLGLSGWRSMDHKNKVSKDSLGVNSLF